MDNKPLVIWGGTGQCIVLEDFLSSNYDLVGVYDINPNINSPFPNVPIFHDENSFISKFKGHNFIVAIGGTHGKIRVELTEKLQEKGLIAIDAIHPTACIANSTTFGIACQVLINATICSRSIIDDCVIVNSSASIDHECYLEKGVHVGPGAVLAGCVHVEEFSFIGTGAIILPRIKIGKNSIVGAGAVVTKHIPPFSIAVGNPARVIKRVEPIL